MSVYCSLHAAAVARLGPAIGGFGTENSGQRSGRRFQRLRDRRGDRSGEERISRHGVRRAGEFPTDGSPGCDAASLVPGLRIPGDQRDRGGKPLTVTLVEQTQQVDDVVVVGYGVQKKESVLGAISQVGTDELVNSGTANITQAITGKLSGITSIQTSGQPGNNDVQLYVRGVSSWNGSDPLVLVDGIERSFSDLDPNEVATISVLKDASATAVFGAKGANGVIIVTTRSGNTGKPKMNISLSYGLDFPTNIPDHVSSAKTAELLNVALKNTQSFGSLIPQWQIDEYARPSSKINTIRYPDTD